MREIKFRAWDKKNKTMILDCGQYTHWHFQGNYLNDLDWMQFTGLLDKNGVEIFESDIIKWGVRQGEVKWQVNGYTFEDGLGLSPCNQNAEVVGNIYQNPELIK